MKFVYIEVSGIKEIPTEVPGKTIATLICKLLGGEGPFERGNYGWEWIYKGNNYKALAVLQQYGEGWLIPVNAGFLDRLFKRDSLVLPDIVQGIKKALGNRIQKLQKFESEKEFRASDV